MTGVTVTRGEFDMLRQIVANSNTRIEAIDEHGTRGIGVLNASITEVGKDLSVFTASVDARFEAHNSQHAEDRKERVSGRRWLIGTAIAGIVAICAVIALMIDLLTKIR